VSRFLAVLLALACSLAATEAGSIHRSLRQIERALAYSCPSLSQANTNRYAKAIQKQAKRHRYDPYSGIGIIKYETGSSCNERLVYNKLPREYSVGLGQINVIWHRSCDESKGGSMKSAGCQAYIGMLMDGSSNIRVMSSMITLNRKMCRKRTGQPALFARWLSSYGGYNGRRGVLCNMRKDSRGRWRDVKVPRHTQNVISWRRTLIRKFG